MKIRNYRQNNDDNTLQNNKELIIRILQIITIYNAIIKGWKVKKIDYKTYELTKNITDIQTFNLYNFMTDITECK